MRQNIMQYATVALDEAERALVIPDQTLLPNEVRILHLKTQLEIHEAIKKLRVRGAPAIGVAAAFGLYLAALDIETDDPSHFMDELKKAAAYLDSSRPTAVNLSWALRRMVASVEICTSTDVSGMKAVLRDECMAIYHEDVEMCHKIGEYGLSLLKDGDGVLTHCNAGQLATSKYGTALAPIHLGREKGMQFHVYCDETRPLLQGARLSAFELAEDGVDTTLICDNMASQVLRNGWVQAVFVGCDRVAANGDACNKIGTNGVAILAKYYHVPFYVLGPTSTIDMSLESGDLIPIEQRAPEEVTEMWYEKRMAPENIKVFNPAFDVTNHELISGIITECGIIRPPFREGLEALFRKKQSSGADR